MIADLNFWKGLFARLNFQWGGILRLFLKFMKVGTFGWWFFDLIFLISAYGWFVGFYDRWEGEGVHVWLDCKDCEFLAIWKPQTYRNTISIHVRRTIKLTRLSPTYFQGSSATNLLNLFTILNDNVVFKPRIGFSEINGLFQWECRAFDYLWRQFLYKSNYAFQYYDFEKKIGLLYIHSVERKSKRSYIYRDFLSIQKLKNQILFNLLRFPGWKKLNFLPG